MRVFDVEFLLGVGAQDRVFVGGDQRVIGLELVSHEGTDSSELMCVVFVFACAFGAENVMGKDDQGEGAYSSREWLVEFIASEQLLEDESDHFEAGLLIEELLHYPSVPNALVAAVGFGQSDVHVNDVLRQPFGLLELGVLDAGKQYFELKHPNFSGLYLDNAAPPQPLFDFEVAKQFIQRKLTAVLHEHHQVQVALS